MFIMASSDFVALVDGRWLSANHMSAVNKVLMVKHPNQKGLQDTCTLAEKSVWLSEANNFVQIIFVGGNHWACLSNCFCEHGSVDLYDSLHTIPTEDDSIVEQACVIMKSIYNLS